MGDVEGLGKDDVDAFAAAKGARVGFGAHRLQAVHSLAIRRRL